MEVEFRDVDKSAASVGVRRHQRRRSSVTREGVTKELHNLPLLRDTAAQEHVRLFRLKLALCRTRFNFDDISSDQFGKNLKRNTLLELINYVNQERGQKIFTQPGVMEDCMSMISSNIFRCLPPQLHAFDVEEDEPVLEPSWPHLQVVYEFLLRFVVSKEVSAKAARRRDVIDPTFCLKLVQIFDSEDPREREYLKTILHRVYGKFMSHRSFIRRQISYAFQRFALDTLRHNGINELLEILGSIINGFAMPLKPEHIRFLLTSLLPLHRAPSVATFHHSLSYCVIQYIDKDPSTAVAVVKGICKYWPWSESSKQVLFLNELEDVLETTQVDYYKQVLPFLLKIVARSLASEHFQVVERTLYLWNNDGLTSKLFNQYSEVVFPPLYPLLLGKGKHWNPQVTRLADEVVKIFHVANPSLCERLRHEFESRREILDRRAALRRKNWDLIKSKHVGGGEAGVPMVTMQTSFVQPPGDREQPPEAPLRQLTLT